MQQLQYTHAAKKLPVSLLFLCSRTRCRLPFPIAEKFCAPIRTRHKGLSTRDHLVTITEIRRGLAMELNLHIGEQIQIPGCRNTSAALEAVRRLIDKIPFPGARKGSG
jgi:hypothetical protein